MAYQFTNKTWGGNKQYELVSDEFIRVHVLQLDSGLSASL